MTMGTNRTPPDWPLVVGLTGGIGVGKSTVAALLAARGAAVIDVDGLGHEVLAPGSDSARRIIECFGPSIEGDDGAIDRAALGAIVFADPAELEALEAISHPAINALLDQRLSALHGAAPDLRPTVVVLDMAVLVESDLGKLPDGRGYQVVVVVEAPLDVRLLRLGGRGLDEAEARRRIASQVDDATRREVADHVVDNGSTLAHLETQVTALWSQLLADDGEVSR